MSQNNGQMLFGVSSFDRQTIVNNNVALAKATRVFDVPVVLSTVETKPFSGNMWPQIQAVFPDRVPIERSTMNSWDDQNFVAAIQKTGRKKIVLTGQRDWAVRGTCGVMDIVNTHFGAYGIGVEYACTMVHGAPATKLPEYAVPIVDAAHK